MRAKLDEIKCNVEIICNETNQEPNLEMLRLEKARIGDHEVEVTYLREAKCSNIVWM